MKNFLAGMRTLLEYIFGWGSNENYKMQPNYDFEKGGGAILSRILSVD